MANVIDISILNSMSTVIVFVLVFIGSWGVFMLVDPFKEKGRSFYGIMAFMLALLMVLSKSGVTVIMSATPWLMLLGLFGFFFIFFAKMFGKGDTDISESFGKSFGWVIFLVAVIIIFAVGQALGPGLLPVYGEQPSQPVYTVNNTTYVGGVAAPPGSIASGTATDDFGTNVAFTIFHPKILGVLFMFLLGTLAIIMLAKPA